MLPGVMFAVQYPWHTVEVGVRVSTVTPASRVLRKFEYWDKATGDA
jgi:hypothetical protein